MAAANPEGLEYVKLCLAAAKLEETEQEKILRRISTTGCTAAKIRVLSAASLAAGLGVKLPVAEQLKQAVLSFDESIRDDIQTAVAATPPAAARSGPQRSPESARSTGDGWRSGGVAVRATYFDSLDGDASDFAVNMRRRSTGGAVPDGAPSGNGGSPLDGPRARPKSAGGGSQRTTPRLDARTGRPAYLRSTACRTSYAQAVKSEREDPDRLRRHPFLPNASVYDVRTMKKSPHSGAHAASYVSEFDTHASMLRALRGDRLARRETPGTKAAPFRLSCDARVSERLRVEADERRRREREKREAAAFRARPKRRAEPNRPIEGRRPKSAGPTRAQDLRLDTERRSEDWVAFKERAAAVFDVYQRQKEERRMRTAMSRTSMAEEGIRKAAEGFDGRTTREKGVKEFNFSTTKRSAMRAEFDQYITDKEALAQQLADEQMRLRAAEEEREVKELRKSLVVRSTPVPDFANPFVPDKTKSQPTTTGTAPKLRTAERSLVERVIGAPAKLFSWNGGLGKGDGSPPEPKTYRMEVGSGWFMDSLREERVGGSYGGGVGGGSFW